jgi:hypothetical protein
MKTVMVRYTVKPERVAENEALVRGVYEELHRVAPEGLRYATFRLADGVGFVHVSSTETEDGRNPLTEIEAFARFQEAIGERCDEAPVVTELTEIGSYRLLGAEAAR